MIAGGVSFLFFDWHRAQGRSDRRIIKFSVIFLNLIQDANGVQSRQHVEPLVTPIGHVTTHFPARSAQPIEQVDTDSLLIINEVEPISIPFLALPQAALSALCTTSFSTLR